MITGQAIRIDAIESPGFVRLATFAGAPGGLLAQVDANAWLATAGTVREGNGHLIALWGSGNLGGAFTSKRSIIAVPLSGGQAR